MEVSYLKFAALYTRVSDRSNWQAGSADTVVDKGHYLPEVYRNKATDYTYYRCGGA